jgi:outer membrane protein, multidrug efflux system
LPAVPYKVALGKIESLLQRRPDIFKAERELASAVAGYNVQVADLYPRVNLIGSLGFSATHLKDIGKTGTSRYLFGPSIEWAAFDLGRVRTRIKIADTKTTIKLAEFEKTVLTAFESVNNALHDFAKTEKEQHQFQQALKASTQATYYADLRLKAGIENMLDYLQIEKTMLTTQSDATQADINVMLALISIYKELGGGWQ